MTSDYSRYKAGKGKNQVLQYTTELRFTESSVIQLLVKNYAVM